MSRPRTKAEDIRNPEHYFNKYIAMEIKHDQAKQQEIKDNECSLEEKVEFGSLDYSIAINKNGELFDEALADNGKFAWLEKIQNLSLYEAVQSLSHEQKQLLTLIYSDGLTQEQLAAVLNISQQAVSRRIQRIHEKIKTFFERGL